MAITNDSAFRGTDHLAFSWELRDDAGTLARGLVDGGSVARTIRLRYSKLRSFYSDLAAAGLVSQLPEPSDEN